MPKSKIYKLQLFSLLTISLVSAFRIRDKQIKEVRQRAITATLEEIMNQESESDDLLSLLLVIIIIVSSGVAYFFTHKNSRSSSLPVPKVCLYEGSYCVLIPPPRFRR